MHITIPKRESYADLFSRDGPGWLDISGTQGPLLRCGNNHASFLTCHRIAEDGSAHPSIVCPEDLCDWHVWARLEDWEKGERRGEPRV